MIVLFTTALSAQIEHVSIGYGAMQFPSVGEQNPTAGGAAYLAIGGREYGGQLWIGGDSQISYGGNQYGSGMVGLTGYRDFHFGKNDDFRLGGFVGILGFQTYEKVDTFEDLPYQNPNPFPMQELKETNIQPFGGIRAGWRFVELQYAPVGNTLTIGIKLF